MTRLVQDRYYAYAPEHGWDLATGDNVDLSNLRDLETESAAPASLVEVLDHGEEGRPRWIAAEGSSASHSRSVIRRAAADARVRGFIPIAADVYLRLRDVLLEEVRGRALLLIVRPGHDLEEGRRALVDVAAQSPRPHVLLTFKSSAARYPTAIRSGASVVREARAVYGAPVLRPRPVLPVPDDVARHISRGTRATEFAGAGRHAAAERLLRDVAGALVRRKALSMAAKTMVTLGRLILERGRASDAERVFDEAARHAHDGGDETVSLGARIWQAAARTDAAQLTAAESLCRAVLIAGSLPRDERARAEATLARVLLWQERVDEAAELALDVGSDTEAWPFVTATAVRVYLATGVVFEAGQRARALMTHTEDGGPSLARVIALSAYVRTLITMGDLPMAEEAIGHTRQAVREARAPLRLARMRLLFVDALRRAGRTRDAERELAYLSRVRPVAPPLLRDAIERRLRSTASSVAANGRQTRAIAAPAAAIAKIANAEEEDRAAVHRTLESVAQQLSTSRLDVCSTDAGPVSTMLSIGSGLATRLGSRVLEAGIVIGSSAGEPGHELGVPVRLGSRLVGALVARWPADRTPPSHTREVLELVAAVTAPRIDAMQSTAREVAQAAVSVAELVGSSAAIADVRRAIARAAPAPFAVLIQGESGVGKELVARAIHHLSPRRERRFCDVNCAALPDELLDSELFGHARGAFTGAVVDRAGLIEDADGGTVFLDEVADLSARAQAKLLRVLQQHEVRRVGETFSRKVDVRVVCAANRDMREQVTRGQFREDLLYRLDVIRIHIPPLRERPEDVPLLVARFWHAAAQRVGTRATLCHATMTALARYHWPGNVRELQNVMAALAVAAPPRGRVQPALLPGAITAATVVGAARLTDARAQFERRFIEVAMVRAGGSRARAARELGLSRQGLLKMMARLGIEERR